MSPFLKQIAEQRAALNATAKAAKATLDKAQADLAKLDQLEALTRQLFPDGHALPTTTVVIGTAAEVDHALPMTAFPQTKKARILTTAEAILSDGRRRTASELVQELAVRGVDVGGRDPNNNLSAYLSPEEAFNYDRTQGGWGLSSPPKKTSPGDAGTSPGLFSHNGAAEAH